jgi:hypothetical protein
MTPLRYMTREELREVVEAVDNRDARWISEISAGKAQQPIRKE